MTIGSATALKIADVAVTAASESQGLICSIGDIDPDPGIVTPGMRSGATDKGTRRQGRREAVPDVATRWDGISFSKAMRPATTAIQTTLMTPSANSDAIKAQQ